MKKFIDKNSIWICAVFALGLTIFIIKYIVFEIQKFNLDSEAMQSMAFGVCLAGGAIFIWSWQGLGWLFYKIFSDE